MSQKQARANSFSSLVVGTVQMMSVDKRSIDKRFEILKRVYSSCNEYNKLRGVRRISITDIESHYGEARVSSNLLKEGFEIDELAGKRPIPYDIRVKGMRIEVKTSRSHSRFKGGKHEGWGWTVKRRQWKPRGFDFLVCIALDRYPKDTLVFTYEEVRRLFFRGSWDYLKYQQIEKDGLRLDLIPGGLDAWCEHVEDAKKRVHLKGAPSSFERKFNKDPDSAFGKYTWERFIRMLRGM